MNAVTQPAPNPAAPSPAAARNLTRFAWMAIATAIATIALKAGAWLVTGSVGLLSDAAESVVNLVAAVVALIALKVAARPADHNHQFGHTKAEYFSAAVEGQMILIAAVVIMWTAVERFLNPQPLENVGIGLGISVAASVLNGAMAWVLIRAGRRYRSLTLTADGKHLLTDVWTSVGVVAGVLLVALTGIQRLDPIIAFAVGVNIIIIGWKLLHESAAGLMDTTMSPQESQDIATHLEQFVSKDVHLHGLRTRVSGYQRFAEVHVLVPGAWTVQQGHDLVEQIDASVREAFEDLHLLCHLESLEDPRSYEDYAAEVPIHNPHHAAVAS